MLVYLVTGLAAAIFAREASLERDSRLSRELLWGLVFLMLFVPSALRYGIGVDYSRDQGYVQLFQIYRSGGLPNEGMDPGFAVLGRIVAAFTDNPQWLFVVTSAIVCGLVLRAIRRLSRDPFFAVVLFLVAGLYLESYNIVRQWIAIALVLNAFEWVGGDDAPRGTRSFVRYLLWVGAAALFHASAIIWVALWPFFSLKLDARRAVLLAAALLAAAWLCSAAIVRVGAGSGSYARYLTRGDSYYMNPAPQFDTIIICLVMLGFCAWTAWDQGTLGRWESSLFVCQAVGVAIALSGLFLPMIFDRFVRYFVPMLVFQLPVACGRLRSADRRRALQIAVVAAWVAASFVRIYLGGQYGVVPYVSVLPGLSI